MTSPFLWLLAIGPLALVCMGLTPHNIAARPVIVARFARLAATIAIGAAAVAIIAVIWHGSWRTGVIGLQGIGFSLYLDVLIAVMLGVFRLRITDSASDPVKKSASFFRVAIRALYALEKGSCDTMTRRAFEVVTLPSRSITSSARSQKMQPSLA